MTIENHNQFLNMANEDVDFESTPSGIISFLLKAEKEHNDNLIETLAIVKPAKNSNSTITSIIRGLFTKSSNLLSLLDSYNEEFKKSDGDSKQLYKNFVNEFLLWIDGGSLLILKKYSANIIDYKSEITSSQNIKFFEKHIFNCSNYIKVIDLSINLVRNPFIIGKLVAVKETFVQIITDFENFIDQRNLNDISFNNIKVFGNRSKHPKNCKVSSFFSLDQIFDRSKNEPFYIAENAGTIRCEIVLLNLSNIRKADYDSMAILSIPDDSSSRSLLYPPFRLNELTIHINDSGIILTSIDFSSTNPSGYSVCIESAARDILDGWFEKLSLIFPQTENNSPISESFLIESEDDHPDMLGLGINVISDMPQKKSLDHIDFEDMRNDYASEAYSSPDIHLTSLVSQEQTRGKPISINDFEMTSSPSKSRKYSVSSVNSIGAESLHSQYDRSLNIINKTLSGTSLNNMCEPSSNGFIKTVSRNYDVDNNTSERPKSSQAEVLDLDFSENKISEVKEDCNSTAERYDISNNYQAKQHNKFSSVPDLSQTKNNSAIFQLSSGSAIDISNFGKSHNPTFGSESSDIKKRNKRKSFFSFFKNSSKSNVSMNSDIQEGSNKIDPESNQTTLESNKEELIDTPVSISEARKDDNRTLFINTEIAQAFKENGPRSDKSITTSTLPSPFALPSSTSTYFFKQYKNGSNSNMSINKQSSEDLISSTYLNDEEELTIPQNLKNLINDNGSIDFYISSSSPKALKVSKWKENYGKWEMLTVYDKLFLKIVVNYELNKCWLILFKEVFCEESDEVIDKPILLLDINENMTNIRQSSALDLQISTTNSVTMKKILIMIRCANGELLSSMSHHLKNVLGTLWTRSRAMQTSAKRTTIGSSSTISSSMMDDKSNNSSAVTSIQSSLNENGCEKNNNEIQNQGSKFPLKDCSHSVLPNSSVYTEMMILNSMTIRLQKQLESYEKKAIPSSWTILSMYMLKVSTVSNGKDICYNLELKNADSGSASPDFNWLIKEEEKFQRFEQIGKAGLLIKPEGNDIYMIECKGKKEFKKLIGIF